MLRLKIKNTLKKNGLSATKTRKKVLKAFLVSLKPLSLQDIRNSVDNLDRVTLFRILSAFEKNKIIHIIRLEDGKKLFALCNDSCSLENHDHNHLHFQCEKCDDVSCLEINNFPNIQVPDYIFKNININISGICNQCN